MASMQAEYLYKKVIGGFSDRSTYFASASSSRAAFSKVMIIAYRVVIFTNSILVF